jgi:transcription termination factor Rho
VSDIIDLVDARPSESRSASDAETSSESKPARTRRKAEGLSGMVLPELQQVASGLGIAGTARMRKSQLVEAITAAQNGAPASAPAATSATGSATAGRSSANGTSGRRGAASSRADAPERQARNGAVDDDRGAASDDQARSDGTANTTGTTDSPGTPASPESGVDAREGGDRPASGQRDRERTRDQRPARDQRDRQGNRSNQNQGQGSGQNQSQNDRPSGQQGQNDRPSAQQGQNDRAGQSTQGRYFDDDDDRNGRRRRRGRGRDRRPGARERPDRFGNDSEPVIAEDDVLIPVAGILDVLDNYAFVRTSGYLPGPNDVYVTLAQVRRNGLRKGDAITGAVRQPKEGERRDKFNALVRLDTVNDQEPDGARVRPEFTKLTPLYPQDRLRLENDPANLTARVIDIVAPIGKGQRGLIVSPPKAGKTMVLQAIANAITANNPEVHLMVVLVDERPEEVTDMQRSVKGEVIASTFDRPAEDHTVIAELAIERAKRLVELGHDVVVLLDSMTRLGRAYNLAAPASGRILSGGVDSSALYPPKRFFGAARNIEDGGSLTVLATALVETGSKMDDVIFEEFKGTGNMELKLDRKLSDKRIFPAVDVDPSGTRKEEILLAPEELKIVWKLRRVLHALDSQQAIELLINKLRETKSNYEFLLQVQKTTPTANGSDD